MRKFKRKFSWRRLLSFGLAVLLIAGAIAGIWAIGKHVAEDKKTVSPSFDRGSIDAATGEMVKSNSALYSEPIDALGLEVELDFDAKISYRVFWYDADGDYVNCTETLTKSMSFYAPYNCKARILITPLWNKLDDEDNEISWYEEWTYANQLEIRVRKNQSLVRGDFEYVKLTDTKVFSSKADHYIQIDQVTDSDDGMKSAPGVTTYWFKNTVQEDGSFISAVYVDSFLTEAVEYGLHVRMKDGTNLYYFNSPDTHEDSQYYEALDNLPTIKDPLYVPIDATVYVWAYFGDKGADNTVLGFY